MQAAQTERLGVSALEYFFSEKGWLFREQRTHDYGIDAHIEIFENERPTGKLIALQIKSGQSFFHEKTDESFTFRTNDKHVTYWLGHSMPVVIVLYNPQEKTAHWKQITRENLESTGRGWKISVPQKDMFADPDATLNALRSLTQPEPYVRRLNRLRVDRHWMNLIRQGTLVRVTFDNWVNKNLPRFQVSLYAGDEKESWPTTYMPGVGITEMLQRFFPWADFEVDEDEYRARSEDQWSAECYSWYDSETGETFYTRNFEDWYEPPEGLVPVSENGETETYVLILSLNDFAESFICIDDFLSDPKASENIGFTLE
jgi:hypothetical protein